MFAIYFTIAVSKMAIRTILILTTVLLLQESPVVGGDVNFDLSSLTRDLRIDGNAVASTVDVEQIRQNIIDTIFEGYEDRVAALNEKIAAAGHDAEAILQLINEETGVTLFVVSDGFVSLDADNFAFLVLTRANKFIRTEFKNNPLQQIVLIEFLKQQVGEKTTSAKKLLNKVPLADVESVIFSSGLKRSRRDAADIFQGLVKTILTIILSPIQTQINAFFNNATLVLNQLYIPADQNNAFVSSIAAVTNQVVVDVRQTIATAQKYVNNVFNNILQQNTTTTTTARKRRDVDELISTELEFWDVQVPHSRRTRAVTDVIGTVLNLIQSLFRPVFQVLNSAVKNLLVAFLSSQYQTIGNIVTYPLRLIVQGIVDTIFPCSTCGKIA